MANTQIQRLPQPNLGSPNHEDASGLPVEVEVAEFSREPIWFTFTWILRLFDDWKKVPFKIKYDPKCFFLKNGDDLPW